jgi:hypothetical protein
VTKQPLLNSLDHFLDPGSQPGEGAPNTMGKNVSVFGAISYSRAVQISAGIRIPWRAS